MLCKDQLKIIIQAKFEIVLKQLSKYICHVLYKRVGKARFFSKKWVVGVKIIVYPKIPTCGYYILWVVGVMKKCLPPIVFPGIARKHFTILFVGTKD